MEKDSIILQKARQLLIDKGWCQGSMMNDRGQFCALGALGFCTQDAVSYGDTFLKAAIYDTVTSWNDRSTRTFEEVLQAFDEATSMAMGEECINDK